MTVNEILSHPRIKQRLPEAVNAGALLLVAASLAQWTWLLAKPTPPPLISAPTPVLTRPSTLDVQPLLAVHLFGQQAQEAPAKSLNDIPISSLNLVLTGVIAVGNGGFALISTNGEPQEPYSVGQTITAGSVLQAVYPDRVVIERNGVVESLLLEGTDKPIPGASDSPFPAGMIPAPLAAMLPAMNARMAPPVPAPVNAAPVNAGSSASIRQVDSNHYAIQRDHLTTQMRSPDFLKQASMVPSNEGGFLVRQIQPGSLYEKLGLRPGDIIRSANGTPVNSVEDAIKLYQQVGNLTALQIEITRGGKPESLHYQLQ